MIDVTVLLLDQTFSSTAVAPMEVFRRAGSLWNHLTGKPEEPRFHVSVASADDGPVLCDGPIRIQPLTAIHNIRKTDLVFIPTTGLSLDDVVERNAAVVPWLKQWRCHCQLVFGLGLVAATGMLNGKRATTRWVLADRFREKHPKVRWMPELMVAEDRGFYCGGGVHAALDPSLYLVEKFCGHEVAMESAKALLIETTDAWQAGFAVVLLKTDHNSEAISVAQDWLHENFQGRLPLEAPALGDEPAQFRAPLQTGDGRQAAGLFAKIADRSRQALLENNHCTMQEIRDAVGHQDVAFFPVLFQRHTGVSSIADRERFGV